MVLSFTVMNLTWLLDSLRQLVAYGIDLQSNELVVLDKRTDQKYKVPLKYRLADELLCVKHFDRTSYYSRSSIVWFNQSDGCRLGEEDAA